MITIYLFKGIILDDIRNFYYGDLENKVDVLIDILPALFFIPFSIIIDIIFIPIYLLFGFICLIMKLLERKK